MVMTRERIDEQIAALGEKVRRVAGDESALERVGEVLARAEAEIDALAGERPRSGAFNVPLSPEHAVTYFPSPDLGGPVSAPALREAAAWWDRPRPRARGHRGAALAQLGEVLSPSEVARRLGVTRMTVSNMRSRGELLGVQVDRSGYSYPAFQFAASPEDGEDGVLRGFGEILRLLPYASPWARARFFVRCAPALDGRTPIDLIRAAVRRGDREALDRVRRYAEHVGELGS